MLLHIVSPVSFVPTRPALESFWSSLFQFSRKITNPQILVSQAVKPEPIQSWCLKWNFPSLATVAFLLIVALHAGVAMPSDL